VAVGWVDIGTITNLRDTFVEHVKSPESTHSRGQGQNTEQKEWTGVKKSEEEKKKNGKKGKVDFRFGLGKPK
jgi:hypothetical protein